MTTDPVSATGVWTFDNAANTPLTCADGITSPSLASAAGANLAVSATAPAATTGASQAGKAVTVTASAAVASTDTASAAAGGSVTIVAGAAARLTSGNARGGDLVLTTGTGIGTGTSGYYQFLMGGSEAARFWDTGSVNREIAMLSDVDLEWTTAAGFSGDVGLRRGAAGIVEVSNGSAGIGALTHAVSIETVATTKSPAVTESGELYTNGADVDGQAITLPNDPTVGVCFEFALTATDSSGAFVIAPSAGETLSDAGTSCATVFSATAAGATARICAVSGGSGAAWFVMSKNGTWTCTP